MVESDRIERLDHQTERQLLGALASQRKIEESRALQHKLKAKEADKPRRSSSAPMLDNRKCRHVPPVEEPLP